MHLALIALVVLLGTAILPAQQRQQNEDFTTGRITVRVDKVNILCTVVDRKGQFVTNLKKEDFIIYDDGKPQTIEEFDARSEIPLSISLLIDTSASVSKKLKFEQDAASEFFYTILRPEDKALLAEFDTGVTLIQDFTNDPDILSKQLGTLRAAGGTSMYDALYLVSEEKLIWDLGEQRKTVIVISDGEDTVSSVTFEEALEMVHRSGAIIFAISTNKGGHFGVGGSEEGDAILEQLAKATGGRVYYPTRLEDLGLAFQEIERELRSQYSISYIPRELKQDGKFHTIRISVKGDNLTVRHRRGYYALQRD
jgi:VWFA-related protein